jgi:hypothetical protein
VQALYLEIDMFGVFSFILLLASVFVILRVFGSSATKGEKILWLVIIIFLPLIGIISWYFVGPGDKSLSLRF